MDEKLDARQQYVLESQKTNYILGCIKKGLPAGLGGDCPTLFCPREASSEVLNPDVGSPVQERCRTIRADPDEATKRLKARALLSERSWACLPQRREGSGKTSLQPSCAMRELISKRETSYIICILLMY